MHFKEIIGNSHQEPQKMYLNDMEGDNILKNFKNILFKNICHIAGIQFEKLRLSLVTKMMDF